MRSGANTLVIMTYHSPVRRGLGCFGELHFLGNNLPNHCRHHLLFAITDLCYSRVQADSTISSKQKACFGAVGGA